VGHNQAFVALLVGFNGGRFPKICAKRETPRPPLKDVAI
jgi:hypothetical protein